MKDNEQLKAKDVVKTILIIILIIFLVFGITTIKSGQVGLKSRFGKILDTPLEEGINFKIPFVESIKKINIQVQKTELSVEGSTRDMQIVNATISVNFKVDNTHAVDLYKQVGNDYVDTIINPAIKESIKTAIAQYNAEEITVNRFIVSQSCLDTIQDKVEKYGIIIEDFNLTDFSFSSEYTEAIEAKKVAEQNLEKAKLEAEQKIVEAEAEQKANALLESTLTDEILKQQFIEKWDGKLPSVYGNDSLLDITSVLN